MAFDYKKEFRAFYLPDEQPSVVTIPAMRFAAVRGKGDPNLPDGEYQEALALLYGILYTIKMSRRGDQQPDGYFDYVVPPLEGLWWQEGAAGMDDEHKERFRWISMIRLPDFVTEEAFRRAAEEAARRKQRDFPAAEYLRYEEGLCVQCMHAGSYDDEPASIERMHRFLAERGYRPDITDRRLHHEIYLSDARKTAPEKRKTVIRLPIARL